MALKVKVCITFPCSTTDWVRMCQIRALAGGEVVLNTNKPIENPSTVVEKITDAEAQLLDKMSQAAHEENATPLMDVLEKQTLGKPGRKPDLNSVASLMMRCMQENGGRSSRSELIQYISVLRTDLDKARIGTNLEASAKRAGIKKNNGIWHLPIK